MKKKSEKTIINRFDIPRWTGADVKQLRQEFSLTYDQLAELLGLNYRSQAKRYEEQAELQAVPSMAFEFLKRLLTAERSGAVTLNNQRSLMILINLDGAD